MNNWYIEDLWREPVSSDTFHVSSSKLETYRSQLGAPEPIQLRLFFPRAP